MPLAAPLHTLQCAARDGTGEIEIRLGALDVVPTDLVPTYELWVARREKWFQVVTGTQQYPAPDCGGVDIAIGPSR